MPQARKRYQCARFLIPRYIAGTSPNRRKRWNALMDSARGEPRTESALYLWFCRQSQADRDFMQEIADGDDEFQAFYAVARFLCIGEA
jgi:hypothetical protein